MSCYSCGGNPNTFCKECLNSKDTWIAPVDTLPDVFMGDFDHLYRTPDGNLYALSPDRTRWLRVNGEAGGTTYDDSAVLKRLTALESKTDNFVSNVGVSRTGNRVKLTYTLVDGTIREAEFEDKDTVSLAYDDTGLRNRVKALEDKPSTKQTISRQGNKLVLSNGGGEVDLPTPNNATAYDDSFLRDKVTALENKVDGGDNLICNSAFPKTKNGWGYWLSDQDNANLSLRTHPFYYNNTENMFVLSNNTQNAVPMASTRFKVKRNTNYSLNFVGFSTDNLKGITVYFLGRQNGNASVFQNVVNINDVNTPISPSGLKQFYFTFNTGDNDEGYLRINNKGTNNSNESLLYISEFDLYEGTSNRSYQPSVKCALDSLGNREDNDKQTLTLNNNVLSISNGNSVTLPNNSQPVHRFFDGDIPGAGNKSETPTVNKSNFRNPDGIKVGDTVEDLYLYKDSNIVNRGIWQVIEVNGNNVKVQGIGHYDFNFPKPDLSGYVPVADYNKLKGALTNLLQNLKDSGAWNQTGSTIFEGSLKSGRNIATGNINLFGGTTDGNAFIRTNNGSTENDLAGGVS